ncbi:MAG: arginase family protein [Candidatus Hodarchaeota archaeon]
MNFFNFGNQIKKDTKYVVFGIPWDYLTSTVLPNSSIAPKHIRNITEDIGYTTEMGFHIPDFKAVDVGDVTIEPRDVEKNLISIESFLKNLYEKNEKIIPIMIGGDHFCTYPIVKVVGDHTKKREDFGVLIFDSHLDFYQEWDKGVYSHATISHRIYDLDYVNNNNLLIVGTRDIDIEEYNLANSENIKYLNAYHIIDGLDYYINGIKDFFKKSNVNSLYVSIDIDVLDPSIAPGTGYAIPGGFSYRDMWKILKEITEDFDVIGFDLVEVAPNLDLENKMTCILAAKLIVEFMYFIRSKSFH